MLNLTYVPTNEQLLRTQLRRPNFYTLRNNPRTEARGYIVPEMVEGQLRWVTANDGVVVPLNELRNARMYLEVNRRQEPQAAYLFVYTKRGGPKHYYVVSHSNIGTWLSQALRLDMLSDEGAGSISSARHVSPLAAPTI